MKQKIFWKRFVEIRSDIWHERVVSALALEALDCLQIEPFAFRLGGMTHEVEQRPAIVDDRHGFTGLYLAGEVGEVVASFFERHRLHGLKLTRAGHPANQGPLRDRSSATLPNFHALSMGV